MKMFRLEVETNKDSNMWIFWKESNNLAELEKEQKSLKSKRDWNSRILELIENEWETLCDDDDKYDFY